MVSRNVLAAGDPVGDGTSSAVGGLGVSLSAGAASRAAVTGRSNRRRAGRQERHGATLQESPGLRILRSGGGE